METWNFKNFKSEMLFRILVYVALNCRKHVNSDYYRKIALEPWYKFNHSTLRRL